MTGFKAFKMGVKIDWASLAMLRRCYGIVKGKDGKEHLRNYGHTLKNGRGMSVIDAFRWRSDRVRWPW